MKTNYLLEMLHLLKQCAAWLLVAGTLFSASTSYADTVAVPLPRPDIYHRTEDVTVSSLPNYLDISLSSWAPSSLHPFSSVPNVSSFSSSFPGISASYLGSIARLSQGDLYFRAGLEFREEGRSAPSFPTENLYLITARLGVEFKPTLLRSSVFTSFAGLSLLPTWATASTSTSSYDSGISNVDIPVELDLGTEISLSSNSYVPKLVVAGQLVVGKILGSDWVGLGVIGGIRFAL